MKPVRLIAFISVPFLILGLFSSVPCAKAEEDSARVSDAARRAIQNKDMRRADFWLSRYLAATGGESVPDDLLKDRGLPPSAFLSGLYDRGFLDWFVKDIRARWGRGDVLKRERYGSMEIETGASGEYFATVVAVPELQSWLVAESETVSRPVVLALGASKPAPMVYAGKRAGGRPLIHFAGVPLGTFKKPLHKVWTPEFADLDGDGVPELWLRYNLMWGNGFTQFLSIYKVKDDTSLALFKEFRGENEGFARRLPDGRVEQGTGIASRPGLSHFAYDRHRVETWSYHKGKRVFVKTGTKDVPHVLRSETWKKFI